MIKEIVTQIDEDMSPFYVNFKEDEYLEGQCTGECEIIYPQDIPDMKYKDLHEVLFMKFLRFSNRNILFNICDSFVLYMFIYFLGKGREGEA